MFKQIFDHGTTGIVTGDGKHGMYTVTGTNGHDGIYHRLGNTIIEPDGKTSMVFGTGAIKTIHHSDGRTDTVYDNGSSITRF